MVNMLPISKEIWEKKYKDPRDKSIIDTWKRVAEWVSANESDPDLRQDWKIRYFDILEGFKFIPGGRITESAGTKNPYANNCFVLDIEDDIEHIYETVKRTAVISKKNGGVGINFSKIRPANSPLSGGGVGSGVVSFMNIFDTSCSVIKTGSKNRRAALIGILNIDHPEIFEFLDAKREKGKLENFNISVSITDEFMHAVQNDGTWSLKFNGVVYNTVQARDLWEKLCYSGWMYNDPGIFFRDTVNHYNNLNYIQQFDCTNPCGELPLFPWGACCLGNINLTAFVRTPFNFSFADVSDNFDWEAYGNTITRAVHFLDNVLDVTSYPYKENRDIAQRDRRIGLNCFAGLGSALAMLGIEYGSFESLEFIEKLGAFQMNAAYKASALLAAEKGVFPSYKAEEILNAAFISKLSDEVRMLIEMYGLRNAALLTAPPVGTGSMLAGNISSGIEPIFALEYFRNIIQPDGSKKEELMEDFAWRLWKQEFTYDGTTPMYFKTSMEIDPKAHINVQAVLQEYIDGSISKTANLPEEYTLDDYKELLMYAWRNGLKGFTTFRSGTREGVLSTSSQKDTPVAEEEVKEFERPRKLPAEVYQILEASGNHTYCIISSVDKGGEKQPWEMFMNASGDHAELYAVIGRLASRLMRKTGDAAGVVKELKAIGGENGYFTQQYGYVKSKAQHIGFILEEYIESLNGETKKEKVSTGEICPDCKMSSLQKLGGCSSCPTCGYSKCG